MDESAAIDRLVAAVASAYGPDAFPVESRRLDCPESVYLTSGLDRRFGASVVALPGRPERYSVMVELYDPPDMQLIPFEIAYDGELDLAGVVVLLGRYRDWTRAQPRPDKLPEQRHAEPIIPPDCGGIK